MNQPPPKLEPLFELPVNKPEAGSRGVAEQIHAQLRVAILEGRLAAGARLPATRLAPEFLGVSRNTAVEIYDRLVSEGLAFARQGAGTVVASPSDDKKGPLRPSPKREDPRLNPFWLSAETRSAMSFWHEPTSDHAPAPCVDLRPGLVDQQLFPHDTLRRVAAQQLRSLERRPASLRSPQGNQGNRHLRAAVARHIAVTRAIACEADDIVITSGAQQAFDLVAKILVHPGRTVVAVEDPGYPPMRVPFAAAGAIIAPIRVDEEGLVVDELPPDTGIVCITPSHQFPLGIAMSPARRTQLLQFARSNGAIILEDDYDGEYRFDGAPLSALRADDGEAVFYVGTFSKSMLPSLRLGFVVPPQWARPAIVTAKNSADWHCSTMIQTSIASFIAGGHLTRHVRRMRNIYRRRRSAVLTLLKEELGRWAAPVPSFYGMHLTALLPGDIDAEEIAHKALQGGVNMHSLGRFHSGEPTRNGIVLGYGTADVPELAFALGTLKGLMSGE